MLLQQAVSFLPFSFGKSTLPGRFDFMPERVQVQFVNEVTRYIKKNHPNFKLDFAEGMVIGDEGTEYGLDNLAQQYQQALWLERKILVASHFEKLFKAKAEENELLKDVADFAKIKQSLVVRLLGIDYFNAAGDFIIYREDLEGTITALVFDLPSSVVNVKPEQAKLWGKSNEELFAIGLENTVAKYQPTVREQKLSSGAVLWFLGGDDVFVTTQVFNLEKYPQVIGQHGSLIIVPHRHALVAYPINDLEVVGVMKNMLSAALGMYKEGPGSISPNLFWYHERKFTNVPYKVDGKSMSMQLPDEFVQMLNRLKEKS